MANVSNYYVGSRDKLISDKEAYIVGNKYRITILTPRLARLEYSPSGKFIDNPTALVINRAFPKVPYSITESETLVQIDTGIFTMTYVKDKDFKAGSLVVINFKAVINNTKIEWQLNSPQARNLKGINYAIDGSDKVTLDNGLYSLDGYTVIYDNTPILNENDTFEDREKGSRDIYLFMYNKDFDGCLSDYFTLTGYPSLIPRYALGAWWYKNDNYTKEDIISLVDRFDKEDIPISTFLLGDSWRGNNAYISGIDLGSVSNYLKQKNIRLGVTIDPLKEIVKNSNEYNLVSNYINSSKYSFIPFSNEKIGIYLNLFINNLESQGVEVFNIDYNNPNDKMGLWKFSHYHHGRHEIVGKRGISMTRNHGIAMHRYPIMWSGKTLVNWSILNILPRYNLQGYNVGVSFIAHPIGGYHGGTEEEELYLRYIQFACFSPMFLLASEGGKYYKREPWKWNPIIKNTIVMFMNLRYKLIPYIYTESYNYHKSGKAITKPFYYDYPKILDDVQYKNQYFFGSNFFVAPITNKKNVVIDRVMKRVFVPEGIWFNFLDGKQYNGNKGYTNFYRDEDYPVFVKAGSITPMSGDIKRDIPETLEVSIYPLANGSYNLYEDDGISNNYKRGMYMITNFSYEYNVDNYNFKISKVDGKSLLSKRNYVLRFKNTKNITEVNILDKSITYNCYYDKNDFVIQISNLIVGRDLEINLRGSDILVSSIRLINEDIKDILYDLAITTSLKEKLDEILFSDLDVKKKRIRIRKLRRQGLDNKYIKIFINLLEYIQKI